jgi:hypothetical protein
MLNLSNFLRSVLPYNLYNSLQKTGMTSIPKLIFYRKSLKQNINLKNLKRTDSVLIVCSGPSLVNIDWFEYENIDTITVSGTYQLKFFEDLNPLLHVVPEISDLKQRYSEAHCWFQEINKYLKDVPLLTSIKHKKIVNKARKLNDIDDYFLLSDGAYQRNIIPNTDLTKILPRPPSVLHVAVSCALYMNYKTILIAGLDDDALVSGVYKYGHGSTVWSEGDTSVNAENSQIDYLEELIGKVPSWTGYEVLAKLANKKGVKIINLNPKSFVPFFQKIKI